MGKFQEFAKKVLPTAMTVVGSGATVAGVILAAREGQKFKEETEGKEMSLGKKIIVGAKIFAPAIGCAALSVACSVGAHMMDTKTQASIMGAYALLEKGYKKYKEKNAEINGEEADDKVRLAIEEERLPESVVELDGDKPCVFHLKNLCEDIPEMTFVSTKYIMLNAFMRANKMLDLLELLSVNDFLPLMEREPIEGGGEIGWSSYSLHHNYGLSSLEFNMEPNETEGGFDVYPLVSADGAYLIDSDLFE